LANKSKLALGAVVGLGVVAGLVWLSLSWLEDQSSTEPSEDAAVDGRRPERGGKRRSEPPLPLDPAVPAGGDSTPPPGRAPAEPEAVVDQPAFLFKGYEAGLNAFDWKSLAESLFQLSRDLPLLGFGVQRGDVSEEIDSRVREHLNALQPTLYAVRKRFPGVGAVGVLTHPAFYPNALAKTLEAAGRPLSAEQSEQLETLARRVIAADAKRLTGVSSGATRLRQVASEVSLRAAFVDEARALLDQQQRIAVGAGPFANRVGLDPLSPGMHWRNQLAPVPIDEELHFVHAVFGDLVAPLLGPTGGEADDAAMEAIRPWFESARRLPRAVSGTLTISGHPPLARALEAATFTADLLDEILAKFDVPTDMARMAQLRRQVLLPVRLP